MPYTHQADYYELGWCPWCGLPEDRDGDCVNPICEGKDSLIQELEELELDNEVTRPR